MRRRLVALGCIVLAVGGVAVAAVVADDDGEDDAVVVAAEASGVPTALELPTTTTEVTVPTTVTLPVTVPSVTLPRLRAHTPATVAAPTAAVAPPAPKPQGGARCGTPSGYAGLGADRTATTGRITLTLTVYSCEVYDGEILQNFVSVYDQGSLLRSARIEYGDGSVDDKAPYPWQCQDPNKPHPYVVNGPRHDYAAPGTYEVVATVGTAACDTGEEQTATVRMTVFRIAGKRPS